MFLKRVSVSYALLICTIVRSDRLLVMNESEKINFKKLSAAVNYIAESVSASNIRVIGCNSCFYNNFNELSEWWRTNVSLTLLNVEKKYKTETRFPKNDFIIMLIDQHFARYLPEFMKNVMGRLRKHKMLVIFQTTDSDTNG